MITDTLLNDTAKEYRVPLLGIPLISLENQTQGAITVSSGIQWKEVMSELFVDAELRPYTGNLPAANQMEDKFSTKSREIEVFLGSCVLSEDPRQLQKVAKQILKKYSNKTEDSHPLEVVMLAEMQKRLGNGLALHLWNAVRNPAGTLTKDLFNGFDTIAEAEITAGRLSAANRNYANLGALSQANIIDKMKTAYGNTADELKQKKLILHMNWQLLDMYRDAVLADLGAVAYNKIYERNTLHFAENVEIRWYTGKKDSTLMQLTTPDMMECGSNGTDERETIEVRRGDNPFKFQFINVSSFGAQFTSIEPQNLCVWQFSAGS